MEERRFNSDEPSFGSESRQSEIIREIIERTACDIEISQAKDHSLTIMVTGKPSCVLTARKDVLSKLQTQVRGCVVYNTLLTLSACAEGYSTQLACHSFITIDDIGTNSIQLRNVMRF